MRNNENSKASRRCTWRASWLSGLVALALAANLARAEDAPLPKGPDLSKYAIDEQNPEKSLPSPEQAMKNPLEMGYLLMDMIARAEAATGRGDHAAAVRYYRAIAQAVPERATAFSKLCQSYESLGDVEKARESCQKALGKAGVTTDDYARWVRLTLRRPGTLSAAEIEEVDSVIRHLDTELAAAPEGKLLATQLGCELGSKLEDEQRLGRCTSELHKLAPRDPRTLTYQWALALKKGEFSKAEQTLAAARKAGLPEIALAEMQSKIAATKQKSGGWLREAQAWSVSAVLLVLCLGYWLWSSRRKQTLSAS